MRLLNLVTDLCSIQLQFQISRGKAFNRAKALAAARRGALASRVPITKTLASPKRKIFGRSYSFLFILHPPPTTMADSYDEIEARIQAALASILPDQKPNIAKLARDYAVPVSRLRARHKGQKDRSN